MEAATKEDFTCEGVRYHVSHLVAVLAKLFVFDERTVDYILTNAKTDPPSNKISTMKLFADLLIVFSNMITSKDPLNQFTCIALYNIIWSISFQPDDQEALRENTPLIDTIKRLAMDERSHICDQYKPRAMQSIKKAADGILYNLHAETKYHTEKSSKTNTETIVTHQIFKPMKAPILQSKPLRYDKGKEADMYVFFARDLTGKICILRNCPTNNSEPRLHFYP